MLSVEYVNINDLTPYKNNAKLHPREQIEQIKKSIELYGMNDPIGVWKDNVVIEGHGRLMACKELNIDTVPIIRLEHLSDKERREYMLVHNQLTMNSDFDLELLELELQDLDFDGFDFDFDTIDTDTGSSSEPEEHAKLIDTFIVPPFSVLDTRQGYWRERREKWEKITAVYNLDAATQYEENAPLNGLVELLADNIVK